MNRNLIKISNIFFVAATLIFTSSCMDASYMKIFGRKTQKISSDKRLPRDNYRYIDYALNESDKVEGLPKVYTEDHHQFNDMFDDQRDIYPKRLNEYEILSNKVLSGKVENRFENFSEEQTKSLSETALISPRASTENEMFAKEDSSTEQSLYSDVQVIDDHKIEAGNTTQRPTVIDSVNQKTDSKNYEQLVKSAENHLSSKAAPNEKDVIAHKQISESKILNDTDQVKDKIIASDKRGKKATTNPHATSTQQHNQSTKLFNEIDQNSKALEENLITRNHNYNVITREENVSIMQDNIDIKRRNILRENPDEIFNNEEDIQIIEGNRVYR